jgi:SAM-dependent methyltransferase
MEKLSRETVSFDSLYRMLIAPVRARLMITGIRLNLFSHLETPVSAGALAQTLGTHPANTALMLDGLAACDLVFKTRGLYRNTPAAEAFLVRGGSTDLGGLFSAWAHDLDTDTMLGLVKEGPPPADPPGEEVWAEYAPAMANLQQAGIAQRIAGIISALPEFSSCSTLLDLGGGPGRIGMAIVAAHPSMTGILFDRPAVARVAERFIEMDGMQARMTAMGGDFIHDSIGKGYDLVWASSVLNAVQRDADRIVRKIYDALNPGGVFVSCHDGLTHERCKPEIMVLGWLPTALAGQDMGLDKGFITDAMARAGFRSVQSSTLDTPMGPMELDIARKG